MDNLSDVMSCCRGLDTEKVTERKKSVEKLRQLLGKKSVIKTLDNNTDVKTSDRNSRLITWDDVFKAVVLYIRLETASLQKSKETKNLTKEKKKQEISGFFKFFIRTADKRGPRLKCTNLLNHITEVLKDEYQCAAFGQDYSTIVLKNVLPVRRYWVEIRAKDWYDLLLLYCHFFLDRDSVMDRIILARLVHAIISRASRQCDLPSKKILVFFTEVFMNIREEKVKSQVLQEHLLSALNIFVKKIAPNSRVQLCKLGETIFVNLLHLWNGRPTEQVKDEIVEFLRIQLQAHHPGGVKTPDEGQYAVDNDIWMSHLRKLYEVMYTDFKQMGDRNRFTSGMKDTVLKTAYVDLAADVCNQLFTESSRVVEVTQLSMSGDGDHNTPRKKRRLESGWLVVRETLLSLGCSHQVIPWLQLVLRLVEKYPTSVPEEELQPLLKCLHTLLSDCKRTESLRHVFHCLAVIAGKYASFHHMTSGTLSLTRSIWETIWSTTLRSMSSNRAEAEGYQQPGFNLLSSILQQNLVKPQREVWNLFLPNVTSPSEASLSFLFVCLSFQDLPENYQPSILGATSAPSKGDYSLRNHLFDWIISNREAYTGKSRVVINPERTSEVLTSLIFRNPESVLCSSNTSEENHWTELEQLYLEMTFNCKMPIEKLFTSRLKEEQITEPSLIPCLMEALHQAFQKELSYFQDLSEAQHSALEDIICCCCVLTKCIQRLLESGVVSAETLTESGLETCLKSLLKKMTSLLCDYVKKEGVNSLSTPINLLQTLWPDWHKTTQASFATAELVRVHLPGKFYDQLFDIVVNKTSSGNVSNNNSNRLGGSRRMSSLDRRSSHSDRSRFDDFDEMDLEFDDEMSTAATRDNDDDMEVLDDIGDSQDSEESHLNEACTSLVSIESLTETQKLRLETVRLLCFCSGHESTKAPARVVYKADMETTFLKSKLVELLDENTFNFDKASDLLILDTIVRHLTCTVNLATDQDVVNVLDCIRLVAKNHRRGQDVCCLCLDLMTLLIPQLADVEDMLSKQKQESREIILHLLSAYMRMSTDGQYAAPVRLSIARCMQAFVQCDPQGEWTNLPSRDVDSIAKEFAGCLVEDCHVIRSYMAEAVQSLFVVQCENSLKPKPADLQNLAFDELYEHCNNLLEFKGKMSAEKQQDERVSRTASVLSVLSTIACTSPLSEKKTMFAFSQLICEREVEVEKVCKVLSKLSGLLGYKDMKQYTCCHLPYLINQWLKLEYKFTEFPHRLLGAESPTELFRSYQDIIVPALFMNEQLDCIQSLSSDTGQEWREVLKNCVPKIVVHILPLFAASRSDEVANDRNVKQRLNLASKCYDVLVEELTNEVKDKIISSNIDIIVVNILMCLHCDGNVGHEVSCAPDPNPPSYNSYIIKSTLDYLTQSFSGSAKTLVSVLAKTQSSIQKVLLELSLSLVTEHRLHEKMRILTMYQLFVEMLLPEFAQELGGSWCFVLRDVVHRLVHVIKDIQSNNRDVFMSDQEVRVSMIEMCLELLQKVCIVALECCPEELSKYLDFIVSHITPFVCRDGALKDRSVSLMNLLILDNTSSLKAALYKLDMLPDKREFRSYRTVLQKLQKHGSGSSVLEDLQRIVDVLQDKRFVSESCTGTLQSLSILLKENQQQLTDLTADTNDLQSVLCNLVRELLHLTRAPCHQVAQEAAICLGVIGPVDLATLSLPKKQPQKGLRDSLEAFSGSSQDQKFCWIFHTLNEYLVDPCITVVKTSGEVLRTMLATKTGVDFCTNYKNTLADCDYLFNYLHPFKCKKKPPTGERVTGNLERFFLIVNSDDVWVPEHNNHEKWVMNLACTLLESGSVVDELLKLVAPICALKPKFSELVLPFLVHDIILNGLDDHWEVLQNRMSRFFQAHCDAAAGWLGSNLTVEGSIVTNKESVQVMLNIVQYLRQQQRPKRGRKILTPWDNNFWLDLNYLQIAKAAQFCAAPFTAIMYAEIWADSKKEDSKTSSSSSSSPNVSEAGSQELLLDTLSSVTSSSVKLSIQELLLEAYQSVGDPDGVYGCGAGRLADPSSRIKTYLHEKRLEKAVVTYDIQLKSGQPQQKLGLLKSLQNLGADHLLELCLRGETFESLENSPDISEIQYEAAWRAGQWCLDVPSRLNTESGFHQALYCAMDAFRDSQVKLASSFIDQAREKSYHLLDGHQESCRSIYPALAQLHSLFHLQQIVEASVKPDTLQRLYQTMLEENPAGEFEFRQLVWEVKCSALKILAQFNDHGTETTSVTKVLQQQLQTMAKFARKEGRYQVAERVIAELRCQDSLDPGCQFQLEKEEAKLFWAREEHNIAKHVMKTLITKLQKIRRESAEAMKVLPAALATYGSWLAETRTENPTAILENYLEKTVEMLENRSDGDIVEAYMALAQFVDAQYQNIANYMKSTTFEAKQALMRKAKRDFELYKGHFSDREYIRTLDKQGELDEREVESMMEDRHKFLVKAVENYINCLKAGDKHDLRIYRLTSLWFDNADSEEVNNLINHNVENIKSYKFLPLMYQLAARMSVKQNYCPLFQPTLAKILETAAVDHPHHAVFVIMALAHANKDTELVHRSSKSRRLSTGSQDTGEEDRVQAAKNLIDKLKKTGKVSRIVQRMEMLSVAYIQLANTSVDKYKKETKPIPLPSSLMITQIKNLEDLPVPTLEASVDPTGQYNSIVKIAGFANTFKLAGGINLPKILTILGSDGVSRRQLVKGRDDLRQDAVMQQVFGMVNNLLQKNPETKKRHLRIRRYKVVPLSQRSGILEWCEGTQPIGEYLIGSKGAHSRYRPGDPGSAQCREMMLKNDGGDKLATYKAICEKFKPVFRHFFMEKFSDPATWFAKRLAYTRSVATNSIVGYILGLGDRHVQNILLDCNSAELIHIDLGIAFEQGKILATPETVPFRLTRDIVDGMGVTGVEGVFRRCCEKMMEVMHTNQESLMMILQVLLYDPLYVWSLSPQQALMIQNKRARDDATDTVDLNATTLDIADQSDRTAESQDSVNKMAERVLLRLQQKLQGIEDGIQLSVSGQVNNLIEEARDPRNLCKLFPGWQPYI